MTRRIEDWRIPEPRATALVDPRFRVRTSQTFIIGGTGAFALDTLCKDS